MAAVLETKSGAQSPTPGPVGRLMAMIESARKGYSGGVRAGASTYPAWTIDAEKVCQIALLAEPAIEIADEAARSDVECHCLWTSEEPALRWLDTSSIEDQHREPELRELVNRSIAYLEGRKLLVRHPAFHAWVRIVTN